MLAPDWLQVGSMQAESTSGCILLTDWTSWEMWSIMRFAFLSPSQTWLGAIFWETKAGPGQRVHQSGQCLIKDCLKFGFNCGNDLTPD